MSRKMNNFLLAGLFFASVPFVAAAADTSEVYFSCGFDDGIPDSFLCTDNDGCELHFTMTQLGFGSRDSWITMREEGTENMYAASASKHKSIKGEEAKPADDWLVLPQIWVKGGEATLSWKGMSANESSSKASSYKVMVSTTGMTPADFQGEPIAIIENEAIGEWTPHSVDLGAYEGQKIFVAFVNNSLGCEVLAIDDIIAEGGKGLAELVITPGEFFLGGEEVEIGGSVTPYTDTPVESISLVCTSGEKTMSLDYDNLGLKYGETFSFAFPEKIQSAYGEAVNFSVSAQINGIDFGTTERETKVLAFEPKRRVVVEEVTGMWCGYCPEGIVAMETLHERYPDEFIGVAVHYSDPLEISGYPAAETAFPGGAPSAWFDRKVYSTKPLVTTLIDGKYTHVTNMGGFETLLLDRLEELPAAEVTTEASAKDGRIHVDATVRFPLNHEGIHCGLSFMLVEDGVWQAGFYQNNYFSGRNEIVGGFENLPSVIVSDMEFNHVLRAIYGGYEGQDLALPSSVKAGEKYNFNADWDLPETTINLSNARLVSVLIDKASGEILNGFSTTLSEAGMSTATLGEEPRIVCDSRTLTASADGEIYVTVSDIAGNEVASAHGRDSVSIDVSSLKGIFIVMSSTSDKTSALKIVL